MVNTSILTDEVIKQMLFTPIIRYDEDLQPQPHLAESWELSDTSVTFTLREDVRWHDGRPVTAEDVKFTFDLAKNPETASLLESAYLNQVESATVVDPRTIRFDFAAPHAQALDGFWWPPLPRHLLENVPPAELSQASFNQNPVGSGPFRFVSWDRNQQMTVEANDSFPEGLGGRPYLDRVVFRVIPDEKAIDAVALLDFTATELRTLIGAGSVEVTAQGSLSASDGTITLQPGTTLVMESTFELVVLVGGEGGN